MRMTIRFQSGSRVEAVLLATTRETMRVIIESQRETSELHRLGECWFTEAGGQIEIEALISVEGIEVLHLCVPLTIAACVASQAA
jgi:hypothetical protein